MNIIATCSRSPLEQGKLVGQKTTPTESYLGHPSKAFKCRRTRDLAL